MNVGREASVGFRLPAEWERHAATWVAWPRNPETWPGCLEAAETEFVALVAALLETEQVRLLAQDAGHARRVRERLGSLASHPRLVIHLVPSDDAWLRDTAPTFVLDGGGGLVAIDWTFNAWGGKYPPWDRDDAVAAAVARLAGARTVRPGLVVEGGALEVDGEGTLLVTEPTLIDARRNPGISREEMEKRLAALLGVSRFVWLPGGIIGDDTDGHVDDIARFVAPGRVVCAFESDPSDPNHEPLSACLATLRAARDARGRPLEVIPIPMPPPLDADGDRLPATHLNFYVANGAVLVPTFGASTDAVAMERIESVFHGRRVIGVPSRTLVRGLGAVHCLTQQQPDIPRPGGA